MRILLAFVIALLSLPALALTPEELEARLASIEEHRAARIATKIPPLTAQDRKKAASGTVVTGYRDGAIYGVGVLSVPIAHFWAALNDEERQFHYTKISHSQIIAGTPCQPGRKVLQILPVPIWGASDRWWIGIPKPNGRLMRNSGGAVRELAFSSSVNPALVTIPSAQALIAQSSPIGFSRGAWFLVALDARHTYVEYFAYSNPGSGIPAGIAGRMATGAVRENFHAIAKFANQGNPSCPIR